MSSIPISRHTLRLMLIEHLKKEPATQVENIIQFGIERSLGRRLQTSESQALLELIHEFIAANILMPAMNRSNTGWPFLAVTTHGREVLSAEGPPVYDYEGYLAQLRCRVPRLDRLVEVYLSESLQAYQRNLFYASMAMLGCASERAIRLLIDAYVSAIDKEVNREKLRSRLSGRDIAKAYEEFRQSFNATRNQVKLEGVVHEFDAHVDGMFTFVRLLRNSIVHPDAIPNVTSALAYANLQQFSYYVETVLTLIAYYEKNSIEV